MSLRAIAATLAIVLAAWAAVTFWPRGAPSAEALTPEEILGEPATPGRTPLSARPRTSAPGASTPPLAPQAAIAALPPLDRPLAEIGDELVQRARGGDVRAACRLAFEVQRCTRLPQMRRNLLDLKRKQLDETLPVFRQNNARGIERLEAQLQRVQPLCEGALLEDLGDAWRWELAAAEAGYPPSMARFAWGMSLRASSNPAGSPIPDLDGWIALRDRGRSFLEAAIDAGEPSAFALAEAVHRRGDWLGHAILPRDPVRALAYALALQRVATPTYAQSLAFTIERATRDLQPAQVAEAERLAAPLATRLARIPAGSLDFTQGIFGRDDGSHCERPPA